MKATEQPRVRCSIERSLEVLGKRWTLLILRESFSGRTRFSEFQSALRAPADVLSARLSELVCAGILEKKPYQCSGERARAAYHLTEAGAELKVILGALQQWGDMFRPCPDGASVRRRSISTGSPLAVAFVDDNGVPVPSADVDLAAPVPASG